MADPHRGDGRRQASSRSAPPRTIYEQPAIRATSPISSARSTCSKAASPARPTACGIIPCDEVGGTGAAIAVDGRSPCPRQHPGLRRAAPGKGDGVSLVKPGPVRIQRAARRGLGDRLSRRHLHLSRGACPTATPQVRRCSSTNLALPHQFADHLGGQEVWLTWSRRKTAWCCTHDAAPRSALGARQPGVDDRHRHAVATGFSASPSWRGCAGWPWAPSRGGARWSPLCRGCWLILFFVLPFLIVVKISVLPPR